MTQAEFVASGHGQARTHARSPVSTPTRTAPSSLPVRFFGSLVAMYSRRGTWFALCALAARLTNGASLLMRRPRRRHTELLTIRDRQPADQRPQTPRLALPCQFSHFSRATCDFPIRCQIARLLRQPPTLPDTESRAQRAALSVVACHLRHTSGRTHLAGLVEPLIEVSFGVCRKPSYLVR